MRMNVPFPLEFLILQADFFENAVQRYAFFLELAFFFVKNL